MANPKVYAKQYCANYHGSAGKCLGIIISPGGGQGIEPSLAGKPCKLSRNQSCSYFDAVVLPGIPKEKVVK